jgi:hypothetical protein
VDVPTEVIAEFVEPVVLSPVNEEAKAIGSIKLKTKSTDSAITAELKSTSSPTTTGT